MSTAGAQRADGRGSFSISSRRLEQGILVALSGDVDLATAAVVDDELKRAEQSEDLIVLDLGEVSFLDSTGLRTILSASQRLRERGASLRIIHVPAPVGRLFELVGVNDYLGISDRVDGRAPSIDGAAPG